MKNKDLSWKEIQDMNETNISKDKNGWKKACFTSGVHHYIKDDKPLCGTRARFSTSKPKEKPNWGICVECEKLLNKGKINE